MKGLASTLVRQPRLHVSNYPQRKFSSQRRPFSRYGFSFALGSSLLGLGAILGIPGGISRGPYREGDTPVAIPRILPNEEQKSSDAWSLGGLSFLRFSIPSISIKDTLSSWTWPQPLANLQSQASALLLELSRGKGSLYDEVVSAPPDLSINPECEWDAEVRIGDDLSISERAFLRERKRRMREGFAKLFGVPFEDLDERDLPIVAIAGSGGGYRAMCNTIGGLSGAKDIGLLDCVTYISGLSGSCWALGILYSGLSGSPPDPNAAGEHIKQRIDKSYLDSSVLDVLTTPPLNKYLLSGLIRKATAPGTTASLVDIYGTLVSARLFVPTNIKDLDYRFLSAHQFRRFIDKGEMPLPIMTAVSRHLLEPLPKVEKDVKKGKEASVDENRTKILERELQGRAEWLWFEFTPYEFGCDELGAWIPMWALGRRFNRGRSLDRTHELSFTILAGVFASAFCASLQHYFKEIQPTLRTLPKALYEWLEDIVTEREKDFDTYHPILPNKLPNYVRGLNGALRSGSPVGITEPEELGFMDAGAELNIPYYPLFRRNVDCIIALDASADSQALWFSRAEEYAFRRGLSTWPKGARWPAEIQPSDSPSPRGADEVDTDEVSAMRAARKLAVQQEVQVEDQATKKASSSKGPAHNQLPQLPSNSVKVGTLGEPEKVYIWIGSSQPTSSSKVSDSDTEEELAFRDGIGIVYIPLVTSSMASNPGELVSTWRLELKQEETEGLLDVAKANVVSGETNMKKVLRAMWLRKRRARIEVERRRGSQKFLADFKNAFP